MRGGVLFTFKLLLISTFETVITDNDDKKKKQRYCWFNICLSTPIYPSILLSELITNTQLSQFQSLFNFFQKKHIIKSNLLRCFSEGEDCSLNLTHAIQIFSKNKVQGGDLTVDCLSRPLKRWIWKVFNSSAQWAAFDLCFRGAVKVVFFS